MTVAVPRESGFANLCTSSSSQNLVGSRYNDRRVSVICGIWDIVHLVEYLNVKRKVILTKLANLESDMEDVLEGATFKLRLLRITLLNFAGSSSASSSNFCRSLMLNCGPSFR